jgi:hypothetical protein
VHWQQQQQQQVFGLASVVLAGLKWSFMPKVPWM